MAEEFNPRKKALKKALLIITLLLLLAIFLPILIKGDNESLISAWGVSFFLAGGFLLFLSYLTTGAPTDYGAESTRTFIGSNSKYYDRMKNQRGGLKNSEFIYMLILFISGLGFIVVSALIVYIEI